MTLLWIARLSRRNFRGIAVVGKYAPDPSRGQKHIRGRAAGEELIDGGPGRSDRARLARAAADSRNPAARNALTRADPPCPGDPPRKSAHRGSFVIPVRLESPSRMITASRRAILQGRYRPFSFTSCGQMRSCGRQPNFVCAVGWIAQQGLDLVGLKYADRLLRRCVPYEY